jgi:hypothetical protein
MPQIVSRRVTCEGMDYGKGGGGEGGGETLPKRK